MFVFVAISTFRANHKNKLFGYVLNKVFYLWDPLLFAFKLQVNKKQL